MTRTMIPLTSRLTQVTRIVSVAGRPGRARVPAKNHPGYRFLKRCADTGRRALLLLQRSVSPWCSFLTGVACKPDLQNNFLSVSARRVRTRLGRTPGTTERTTWCIARLTVETATFESCFSVVRWPTCYSALISNIKAKARLPASPRSRPRPLSLLSNLESCTSQGPTTVQQFRVRR
uniref:Uncharacterized protein n=1 Tax=Mycena chlorophos TaxID=658473 RepID=A0ABQ0L5X5_MYCCL|nr:predicted protein [Mycena chlorophos]